MLADKVSGNLVGIWLLIPEYLRLGVWDLIGSWSGQDAAGIKPRLALQQINEAALCDRSLRAKRSLNQQGLELANGLPFLATDEAMHHMLNANTVADAIRLQGCLGKIRNSLGHYQGEVLMIDPHRMTSYSKRQMVPRQKDRHSSAGKLAQTFFCFCADTQQPIAFLYGTSSRSVTKATRQLLEITGDILPVKHDKPAPLVLGDTEHYTADLLDWGWDSPFDLLVPMPNNTPVKKLIEKLAQDQAFVRHWAGYATANSQYNLRTSSRGPFPVCVQRQGERPDDCEYQAFLATGRRDYLEALSKQYPKRWNAEVFYRHYQDLGWHKAGTMNQNIRFGQMTLALIAQAASYMLRARLPDQVNEWNAKHLAKEFFRSLEGDIRVKRDTILVTYYNAPDAKHLAKHYCALPDKLEKENIDPRIPWLCNFKLDFAFK